MSEPTPPTPPTGQPTPPTRPTPQLPPDRGTQVARAAQYFEANRSRFTEEALVRVARDEGYPDDVIEEARARARALDVTAPTRRRARQIILGAYLLTFVVLVVAMFSSAYARQYGGHVIGSVILAVILGLAYLLSAAWLRWRGQRMEDPALGLVVLLSVPAVLLVIVAGACVATGLPIPRQG
jgi:hypothetical protein